MKKFEELTKEELAEEIRKSQEDNQNKCIKNLETDIDWLIEKAMKTSYKPTDFERTAFNRIRQKLENMNKWF